MNWPDIRRETEWVALSLVDHVRLRAFVCFPKLLPVGRSNGNRPNKNNGNHPTHVSIGGLLGNHSPLTERERKVDQWKEKPAE